MRRQQLWAVAAAVLFLASLAFPYWTASMKAPAYPEQALSLQLYAYKYAGEIDEWNRVGRLVGVRVPPPVPDQFFGLFTGAVVVASLVAIAAAFQERWLVPAVIFPLALMAVLAIWGQIILYEYGHSLDPQRPLRYLEPFTPPVVGVLTLGKIVTYHFPNLGSLLFFGGVILLALRAWQTRRPRSRLQVEMALA